MAKVMSNCSVLAKAVGLLVVLGAISTELPAQKETKPKPEVYSVVQVDDDIRVIKKSELGELKKKADSDFKQAQDKYKKDQKEAQKNKAKFEEPPPKKAKIKVLGATIKTEEEANKFRDKELEKRKKTSKGGEKTGKAGKGNKGKRVRKGESEK